MSSFTPTSAELTLTSKVFAIADPQKLGIVTGDTAVKVLSGARLSHAVLGEVWAIADKDNNGFLTKKGVGIALRLIGYAQKGEAVSEALLDKPGPLAHIEGVSKPIISGSPVSSPVPQSSPSTTSSTFPSLTQQDKAKFLKLFIGCGPVNGLLSGDKARNVFVKSELPYEKLSHIWTLADTKTRGALDSTDFTVGMYLIQASMSSPSFTLPSTLPSWIYNQASQSLDSSTSITSHATGGSISALGSPLQSTFQIPRQYTGSSPATLGQIKPQYTGQRLPQTPTRQPTSAFLRTSTSPPATSTFSNTQPPTQPWGISQEAKVSSDKFFDGLDSQHRGYIEGDVAVPFMLESKLPENELAQIWDLADLNRDGRLTREGFAVAMHIINSRLAGNEIPPVLPLSLIPPSLRQSQPSAFGPRLEQHVDLLLDDTPPNSAFPPQQTGGSEDFRSLSQSTSPLHNSGQDVIPSSSQNVFAAPSRQYMNPSPAINKDLLGDDDGEGDNPDSLPDNSAEIGNLRNQLSSTNRSLDATRSERQTAENTVTQQTQELSQLQAQLAASRAAFETESQLLSTLRERVLAQKIGIQKTREELINAESNLSATKVEKAEVEGSVLRDKEDVRELQRRMKDAAMQTEIIKADIEKLKKDARQQKGLLAIAKKQLATAENERLKAIKELEVAQKEFATMQKEKEDVDLQVTELENVSLAPKETQIDHVASPAPSIAAAVPLPDTPHSTTPQLSVSRQSNNPFERLAFASMGSDSNPPFRTLSSADAHLSHVDPSDPFGFALLPPNVTPDTGDIPAQSLWTSVTGSEPTQSTSLVADTSVTNVTSPVSSLSPSDNEHPFLTPPTTANAAETEHGSFTGLSETQRSDTSTYIPNAGGDDHLDPLHEIEHEGSGSSDSDEEPLSTKMITVKKEDPSASIDVSTSIKSSSDQSKDLEAQYSSGLKLDDKLDKTPKTMPPNSGKSSPRNSHSPGPAISTRSLSPQSVDRTADPFSVDSFLQTPLEPPAGDVAPPPTIETVLEPNTQASITSGVSHFDESLSKLPTNLTATSSTFKFDSAFDDNFDFSSATNREPSGEIPPPDQNGVLGAAGDTTEMVHVSFPPVSSSFTQSLTMETPLQPSNPSTATQMEGTPFDSPFPPISSTHTNGTPAATFDDAFGLSTPPALNGSDRLNAVNVPSNGVTRELPASVSVTTNPLPPATTNPFPTALTPRPESTELETPPPRPASPAIRPASPRLPRISIGTSRASSPPLRATSPRHRAHSGSKTSAESKPEGTSKHKLSIRFPFGRKDKTKDKEEKRPQPPAPPPALESQRFLTPIPDPQLPGTITPAVEDDAEPVKQLAAMGFSRTQSIAALEAHGYDMQRALNSLLGAA